jgi:hypothetical protein
MDVVAAVARAHLRDVRARHGRRDDDRQQSLPLSTLLALQWHTRNSAQSLPLSPPPPHSHSPDVLNLLGGLMKEGGRNISYRNISILPSGPVEIPARCRRIQTTHETNPRRQFGGIDLRGRAPAGTSSNSPESRPLLLPLLLPPPPARLLPSACSVVGG